MSESDPNYRAALNAAEESWPPAIGLVQEGFSTAQSVRVRQNNVIIELLLSLHKRVANLELQLSKQDNSIIQKELGNLTQKLAGLSLGKDKQDTITPSTRVIAVWKDPVQQIKDFQRKNPIK